MIVDVFKQLNIKPNKQSVEYADSFIKSNGGYSKYFKEYKKGMAPKPPKFESKSDIPKKNPKVVISNFEETKNLVQPNKTSMNFSTTPNTLKPPSRPPPKPPVYQQDNKLETNITHNKSEFLSPVSSGQKYESDGSNYVTPETQNVNNDNINIIQVRQVSSAHEEPRSALLKSIENFKGGLRRVTDQRENIKISPKFNENDPMSQLIKALGEIRPFLNQSSDESDDEDENFSF
ncbi:unnamed protein product [Brachionus calyciflorus]|uniref:Uncharacterized protein n=1 Tax=Brachionus calyciflorus TaxID=104777 RepID=A0A814PR46_9BILA|nr:unnamed protein product [Brachionus calyciflorus]